MSFQLNSSGPASIFFRIPTVLILGAGVLGFVVLFKPSLEPDIFIFSYFRATALCLMALVVFYAAISLRFAILTSINKHIFYTLIFGVLVIEAALRAVPSLIPDELVYLLPETDRKAVAAERGLFTQQALSGEGMLFHWKPNLTLAKKSRVEIDANGYRNRALPKGRTDVVILGASVPLAVDVPFYLADRFNQAGHRAYSLAMGSPTPLSIIEMPTGDLW